MRTIAVVISVAALGVIAAACGGERSAVTSTAAPTITPTPVPAIATAAQPRALTGTITFDGDPAIPAGAVLTVEVRDVSLQDVASVLIASQTIENPDRFPIEFSVPYDPGDIDTRSDYGMQITISLNDQLIYTNDTAFYVIPKGTRTATWRHG